VLAFTADGRWEVIVRALLEWGKVDSNTTDSRRLTFLSFAAKEGVKAIMKLLLMQGHVNLTCH